MGSADIIIQLRSTSEHHVDHFSNFRRHEVASTRDGQMHSSANLIDSRMICGRVILLMIFAHKCSNLLCSLLFTGYR